MKKSIEVGQKIYGKLNLDKFITKNKEYSVVDFNKESIIYIADNGQKMTVNYNNINDYFDTDKTDKIVESVITKYLNRSKVGIEKYGTTLQENNHDNFLLHLQEELQDATLYIEKLMNQQEESITSKVLDWADKRDLLESVNSWKQYAKLQEESLELYNAMLDDNKEEIIDALGDIGVVMIILANQLGYDFFACIEKAYEVIKNRTGITIGGTFIKS